MRFNSRSREGSDAAARYTVTGYHGFNSRSREGSDCSAAWSMRGRCGFNSRSREGSDVHMRTHQYWRLVSIRAPARGATSSMACDLYGWRGFNSRSREGSDCHHRMAGTVWHKSASCASLPARYRGINGILYTIWKIIILFNLLALSLISRHFAENRWLALNNQGIMEYVRCGFGAIMLNFIASFTTEHIKAQAVGFRLISLQQFAFKARPLFRIYITFKNGILHAHAIILAVRGYLPQAFRATCVSKGNIVGN